MAIAAALLPEFDNEMATTRKVLERVPADKFGWRPHDKSMPFGKLASHVATLPSWAVNGIELDELDIAPVGQPPYTVPEAASSEELLATFDKCAADARAAIAGASDETLMQTWTLLKGGQKVLAMPRVAVLRVFVMNHVVHHRGQLSVYLRLNDIPVPSIYGPSADEAVF